jgi:hypothetical protein
MKLPERIRSCRKPTSKLVVPRNLTPPPPPRPTQERRQGARRSPPKARNPTKR